jgi:hypothetical protein
MMTSTRFWAESVLDGGRRDGADVLGVDNRILVVGSRGGASPGIDVNGV